MRLGGQRKNNCTLTVANYGSKAIPVVTLGFGLSVTANVGESRNTRTFYPYARVAGQWYVEAAFSSVDQREDLNAWVLDYIIRTTDQWSQPLAPIVVTIPSQSFMRIGYPTSTVAFGDAMGTAVYSSVLQFASGSDPFMAGTSSRYSPPTRDATAQAFYPADDQSHSLPRPADKPLTPRFGPW